VQAAHRASSSMKKGKNIEYRISNPDWHPAIEPRANG